MIQVKVIRLNDQYFISADPRQFILNEKSGGGFRAVAFAQELDQILSIAVSRDIRTTPDARSINSEIVRLKGDIARVLKPVKKGVKLTDLFVDDAPVSDEEAEPENEEKEAKGREEEIRIKSDWDLL
jgi:hypothetical protein